MAIEIGDAVWRIGGDLSALDKALDDSRKRINSAYGNVLDAGRKLGLGMTAVGGSIAAGLGVAVKAASDFESGLSKVATLGVKNMDATAEAVKNVVRVTGTDLADAFDGAYNALSAGIPEENLFEFLEASAQGAVAGMSDFSTSIDYAKTMVNVFGTDVNVAMDQAFITAKLGVTTFGELAQTIGDLAPTWKAAGLASEEMLASIAAVTKQGLATNKAVTGLKAALANVIKPTSDAADMTKLLGVEFDVAALKAKGWGGFLTDMIGDIESSSRALGANKTQVEAMIAQYEQAAGGTNKFKGELNALRKQHAILSDATDETIAIMAKFFGSIEGLNAVLALTSEGGMRDFNATMDAMRNGAGATVEAFEAFVKQNPAHAWKALRGELTIMAVEVGQKLTPALLQLAQQLRPIVEGISEWIRAHPQLTAALVSFSAAMAALFLVLGPFLVVLPGIATAVGALQTVLGLFTGAVVTTTAATAAAGAAVTAAGAAVGGFSIAAGAAALVVGGLQVALVAIGVNIVGAVVGAFNKLNQAVEQMVQTHRDGVKAEREYEQQLQSMGVAIDDATSKQEFSNERLQALNAARIAHREEATRREIELLTGYEITAQEFHNAELARVGADLSARQAATLVKAQLSQEEVQVLLNLDKERQQSFARYVQMLIDTEASAGEIARGIRNELVRLSLDTRQSPSINDLVLASTRNTVGIFAQMADGIIGVVAGLHDTLARIWAGILDGAARAMWGLQNAMSSVGIPAFAQGGTVRGGLRRAMILAGEEGPEFATLPSGKRVLLGAYGPRFYQVPVGTYIHDFHRTMAMLARGVPYAGAYARGGTVPAVSGAGVTVNVSIPSVSVREEVDVRRISEEIAARVSRALVKATR